MAQFDQREWDEVIRLCGRLNREKVRERPFIGFAEEEEEVAYVLAHSAIAAETVRAIVAEVNSYDGTTGCSADAERGAR